MKLNLMLTIVSLFLMPPSHANEITNQIGNAGFVHQIWTELVQADDYCPSLTVDVAAFDIAVGRLVSDHMDLVKGMQLTVQGRAWYNQRKAAFQSSPEASCATAWAQYGENGTLSVGLLKKRK